GPVHHPEALGDGDGSLAEQTYPNFLKIAQGYGIAGESVRSKADFPDAMSRMLNHDGPYLLEAICPYQEHVLPMIPSGKSARDIITE
ncbi:MAG: thiamine pyrophosphate-dependent enzyme, partial [Planctomycetaceae bacterium]